jgi:hypothetical protein
MPDKFSGGVALAPGVTPSPVLFVPGSHYIYAGGSDGRLYELDVLASPPTVQSVVLAQRHLCSCSGASPCTDTGQSGSCSDGGGC